ncbi:hypothetical protein [Sporosarcina aquimarina]|uniref:hypothetical protein n=1 Tax=Sporosarcina aquimarina TaxID=114975 RepID=UPI001C8E3F7D|nr:hypothetical protein [Sporosarcina aquimarina]MBY0223957.1 hypothetical protein [Sporosarcina aquimarina]
MRVKTKFGVFFSVFAVIGIALVGFMQKEPYSTEAVMDSLWDNHNVQSTSIGDTDSVLDVSVYEEKDITEVESYLKNNLSKEDLEHYKLIVYRYSENQWEFRENAQGKHKSVYK